MKHLLLLLLALSLHAQTVSINTVQFGDGLTVGAASAVNSLTNGLIAYWTFDTMGADAIYPNSVAGSPGMNSNASSYQITGIIGNAWGNTRASGRLSTNAITTLMPTNQQTISWWMRYTNTVDGDYLFSGNQKVLQVQADVAFGPALVLIVYTNINSQTIGFDFQKGIYSNWNHFSLTFSNRTDYRLYTNGVYYGMTNTICPRTNESMTWFIGGREFSGNCGGHFDDFRIYNRVISSNEIYALSRTNTFLAQ